MKQPLKEHYYAIVVGSPPKYSPYFMLGDNHLAPCLYPTRGDARMAATKLSHNDWRVVVVAVTETRKRTT